MIDENGTIEFWVQRAAEGGLMAEGDDDRPAFGRSLAELRSSIEAALRARFGRVRRYALLLGPRPPIWTPGQGPGATSDLSSEVRRS